MSDIFSFGELFCAMGLFSLIVMSGGLVFLVFHKGLIQMGIFLVFYWLLGVIGLAFLVMRVVRK